MATSFPTVTLVQSPDELRSYIFDFSNFPEVAAGGALSSPAAPAVAGLTLGAAAVTAAAEDHVAAGKGVEVAVSGGTAGTDYTVVVRADCTLNAVASTLEIRLNLQVR